MATKRPVAVITGASSGLGAEFARVLAARNYDLLLVARRRERLEALAQELMQKNGVEVGVLGADLALDDDLEEVARRISENERLELLVNNAGFGVVSSFHASPAAPHVRMHRVHVLATMRLTHAALGRLMLRNCGGIINVSSVAGFIPGHASYSSTKAWMIAFTECLHLELKSIDSRVRMQVLCPGFTYTEFHDLAGMDRYKLMPNRKFWMAANFVVAASLKHFDRGNWLVVPGWRYRLLVALLRVLPREVLDPLVVRFIRRRESSSIHTNR